MSGSYMGKDFGILFELFKVYQLDHEEQLLALYLLQILDKIRSKEIQSHQSKKTSKP